MAISIKDFANQLANEEVSNIINWFLKAFANN